MLSQANISPATPMGATLVAGGGATFRVWAPRATAVYVNGVFGGTVLTGQTGGSLLAKDTHRHWARIVAAAPAGGPYCFWVDRPRSHRDKRATHPRALS